MWYVINARRQLGDLLIPIHRYHVFNFSAFTLSLICLLTDQREAEVSV